MRLFAVSMDGVVVRALALHQCGPGSIPARVEFVVGSPPVPRGFSGFSGVAPSSKTNISKFQLDQAICRKKTVKAVVASSG